MAFTNKEHYNSLYKAILSGIRLIDTASNYSDTYSEILVGNVLSDLIKEGKIYRKDLTIITKVGFIQGQNYKYALKKKLLKEPFKNVLEYSEGTWYCISPDFLSDQLSRQIERLFQSDDTKYIDGYLLHNPEIFFDYHEKSAGDDYHKLEYDIQTEYYIGIKKAFEFLEEQVKKGVIKNYGISSNTLQISSDKFDFTSLERLIDIAKEVSSKNHFKYIQFPFNVFETDAFFEKNQRKNTKTLLETAAKNNLIVLTNRPLNAITNKGLIRLVEYYSGKFSEPEFQKYLNKALDLEKFINELGNRYLLDLPNKKKKISNLFNLVEKIKENWKKFSSIEHLNHIIEYYFISKIVQILNYFNVSISTLDLSENTLITEEKILSYNTYNPAPQNIEQSQEQLYFKLNLRKYLKEIDTLLNHLIEYFKIETRKRNNLINKTIIDCFEKSKCKLYPKGSDFKNLTLSQKAIQIIRSVPGVSYVLVGARREDYVDDIIELLNYEHISNIDKLLESLREEFIKDNFISKED